MAGACGIPTAETGLADLWPFECAAAAAKLAPNWNKKKLGELLTKSISLDIFGYIRGGNVPATKNKGKQMNDEHKYSWTTDGDCFIDFVVQKTSHVIDTFAWAVGRNSTYPNIAVYDYNILIARSATYQGL